MRARIRPRLNRRQVKHDARALLAQWRELLTTKPLDDGRQLLREALVGPIRFTPEQNATLMYRFEGDIAMGRLLKGVASLAPYVASPAGFATTGLDRRLRRLSGVFPLAA
jgi:hypothetical protein